MVKRKVIETGVVALDNKFAPKPKTEEIKPERKVEPRPLWVQLWPVITEGLRNE